MEAALARYSRQMLFQPLGEEGQRRLASSRVTLIGCGALGTHLADMLVRAGVGFLRIVDRDFIELDNLQRQVLFDEHDFADNLPKSEAARRRLAAINSGVNVEAVVADANYGNIESLCNAAQLILDGTDNFETRFLINDVAVKHGVPWVYGACIGAEGMVMPIVPGRTPCLRCIWQEAPPPGSSPTCDTVGVIAPVVSVVTGMQGALALRILAGRVEGMSLDLHTFDVWSGAVRSLNMQSAGDARACPCCVDRRFDFLEGRAGSAFAKLCGRNAVQIAPVAAAGSRVNFAVLAERLPASAAARHNAFLLRFVIDELEFTVFPDGRAIIKGTDDVAVARGAYARYVGS